MSNEIIEIKENLTKLAIMINMLIPAKFSVSFLSENTGKSRQTIHQYLVNNFEPDKNFWREGGKVFVDRQTAMSILSKYNNKIQLAA